MKVQCGNGGTSNVPRVIRNSKSVRLDSTQGYYSVVSYGCVCDDDVVK